MNISTVNYCKPRCLNAGSKELLEVAVITPTDLCKFLIDYFLRLLYITYTQSTQVEFNFIQQIQDPSLETQ